MEDYRRQVTAEKRVRVMLLSAVAVVAGILCSHELAAVLGPSPPAALAGITLPANLRDGDLVFRQGRDVISGAVLALDPNPQYSHVGILARHAGAWFVIHSLPPDYSGDQDGVRLESLQSYLSPSNARTAAVYRLRADYGPSQQLAGIAVSAALALSARHAKFDADFDLRDGERLYCTELVWRAFRAAGIDLAPVPDRLSMPLRSGYFILPSTLARSGALVRVK